MPAVQQLRNYINGDWVQSEATEKLAVLNPATNQPLGEVPLAPADEVDQAVQAAQAAFADWRGTPAEDWVQFLFRLKYLLDE